MLEIIAVIALARKLADVAVERRRSRAWAALGVLFWFGGEVMGFTLGELCALGGVPSYLLAITVGGVGAYTAYTILQTLPTSPVEPEPAP